MHCSELEMREGKNREIRRLLAKVGHKVIALERIAFGLCELATWPVSISRIANGRNRRSETRTQRSCTRTHDWSSQTSAETRQASPEQPAEAKDVRPDEYRPEGARAEGVRSRGSRAEGSRPDARGEARSRSKSKSTLPQNLAARVSADRLARTNPQALVPASVRPRENAVKISERKAPASGVCSTVVS